MTPTMQGSLLDRLSTTLVGPGPGAWDDRVTASGRARPVVVCGVDGSVAARQVLTEAVRSAVTRAAHLRVVAAFDPPERSPGWSWAGAAGVVLPSTTEVAAAVRADVTDTVEEVLDELVREFPDAPELEIAVEVGPAASVLLAEAQDAVEIVVGHRGQGAHSALGSVALACVRHARCPVTVVPEPARWTPTGSAAESVATLP